MNKVQLKKWLGDYSFTQRELNELLRTVNSKKEIWKDIDGYEGYYQISNWGRVNGLLRINHYGRMIKEKVLVDSVFKVGYRAVRLCKGGVSKVRYIHRLMAFAFIPNPLGKKYINHLNGIKQITILLI